MPAIKLKEDPVKNKKENSKKWRANIKANPELYKVFCDSEKERVREYRLRQSEEVKSRDRELQRERQRQYRLRKKEKENSTWKKEDEEINRWPERKMEKTKKGFKSELVNAKESSHQQEYKQLRWTPSYVHVNSSVYLQCCIYSVVTLKPDVLQV